MDFSEYTASQKYRETVGIGLLRESKPRAYLAPCRVAEPQRAYVSSKRRHFNYYIWSLRVTREAWNQWAGCGFERDSSGVKSRVCRCAWQSTATERELRLTIYQFMIKHVKSGYNPILPTSEKGSVRRRQIWHYGRRGSRWDGMDGASLDGREAKLGPTNPTLG
jgi:hypothetical protein